ncbi:MAG: CoB--CoM heterodisulfide reductase iron-sulfur subunit B family protein [Bacteroidota bacterium]
MKYLYFPGCSLKSSGKSYEESLLAVLKRLDFPLEEINDWNCCGATSYMAIDEHEAFALAARNLALAEEQSAATEINVLAPCSACYMVLTKAQHSIRTHPEIGKKVKEALRASGMNYEDKTIVRHPLDVFVNEIGLTRMKAAVENPLRGLRVASYYGCQVVRPFVKFDDPRMPVTMDKIVETLGGTPVDWPLKTRCCGGNLTSTIKDVGIKLNYHLLEDAERRKADIIITACPLCQFNLECYRREMKKMFGGDFHIPVIYFTQLIGLAFGIPEQELGIHRNLIPPTCATRLTREEPVYA